MAVTGVKYDDGSMSYARNCFPVKGLLRQTEEGDGAWLVAHRAEQRKQFKAVLCAKPLRTYSRLREERKKAERKAAKKSTLVEVDDEGEDENQTLDGFYLMKQCCVEDPSDLCSINICGKGLSEVKEEDFVLFDNVAYVNAGENFLPLEAFRGFPLLRELELPLNGLRNIYCEPGWFSNLEMLDLSYNNLSLDDINMLGLFPSLRVLHLTGNNLKALPADLSRTTTTESGEKLQKFAKLEMLMLDDNRLCEETAFAALAGLRNLKHLNLQHNQICAVPQLRLVDNQHVQQESPVLPRKKGRKSASGRRSSRNSSAASRPDKTVPEIDVSNIEPVVDTRLQHLDKQSADVTGLADAHHELDTDRNLLTERTRQKREEQDALMMDSFRSLQLEDPGVSLIDSTRPAGDTLEEEAPDDLGDIDDPLPPPFPELRYLDLSHNQISLEEDLLAVAAWPMLCELVIHDNPLTTQRKGDPPLLTRFLNKRLGIKLQRKKPTYSKPHIEVPKGKPNREVKLVVPPIPKVNVDELLMLEAPPAPTPVEDKRPSSGQSLASETDPLPPIKTQEGVDYAADMAGDNTQTDKSEENGDTFFMTQIDEQHTEHRMPSHQPITTDERIPTPPQTEKPAETRTRRKKVAEKYKGYELLLDVEDDPGIVVPTDIQGNVRALDYTLKHPIKFRENEVVLDRHQKPYKPFVMKQHGQGPAPSIKTQQDKVDNVVQNAKNRQTYQECDLTTVLCPNSTDKVKQDFPDGKTLLTQVQMEFNIVRVLRAEMKAYLAVHDDPADKQVQNSVTELQNCLPLIIRDAVITRSKQARNPRDKGPTPLQYSENCLDERGEGGSSVASEYERHKYLKLRSYLQLLDPQGDSKVYGLDNFAIRSRMFGRRFSSF